MFAKFGVLLVLGVALRCAHSTYDVGQMSPVGDVDTKLAGRERCRPYPAFALTGALEVAYRKLTGRPREFSVQEIVDCYHEECRITRFDDLVNWLIVNDRLAAKDKYTEYRGKSFTCRAGTSPDGLSRIRVTGLKRVEPENFEREIRRYGAVMACVDTSVGGCPQYSDSYRGGVITGDPSREKQHCTERVLITGYDETSYKVRAARGAGFGERGYARIARGGNTCGIEGQMTVLLTTLRMSKPGYNPRTGCPEQYPKYCTKTRTCKTAAQKCAREQKPANRQTSQRVDAAKYQGYQPASSSGSRPRPSGGSGYNFGGLPLRRKRAACRDNPMFRCAERVQMKEVCANPTIAQLCPVTCGKCPDDTGTGSAGQESESGCRDTETRPGECARLAEYCDSVPAIRIKCAVTCNTDPSQCDGKDAIPAIDYSGDVKEPPKGSCYAPTVANGRVLNGQTMRAGETLRVACSPGYTLVGADSKCEIQNVFEPDTRRLPECVVLGGEDFEGNGATYNGALNSAYSGRVCDNWLELAHTGRFVGLDKGRALIQGGNHNYCRNIGGNDFTPSCYTSGGQLKEYCFELPRCGGTENDLCSVRRADEYAECATRFNDWDCELEDERMKARVDWLWSKCAAKCCAYAGCQ